MPLKKIQKRFIAWLLIGATTTHALSFKMPVHNSKENILVLGTQQQIRKAILDDLSSVHNYDMIKDSVKIVPIRKKSHFSIKHHISHNYSRDYVSVSRSISDSVLSKALHEELTNRFEELDHVVLEHVEKLLIKEGFSTDEVKRLISKFGWAALEHDFISVRILVVGSASPEGVLEKNKSLARKRALSDSVFIEHFLEHNYPDMRSKLHLKTGSSKVITRSHHLTKVVHWLNGEYNAHLNVVKLEEKNPDELARFTELVHRAKKEHPFLFKKIDEELAHLRGSQIIIEISVQSKTHTAVVFLSEKMPKAKAVKEVPKHQKKHISHIQHALHRKLGKEQKQKKQHMKGGLPREPGYGMKNLRKDKSRSDRYVNKWFR